MPRVAERRWARKAGRQAKQTCGFCSHHVLGLHQHPLLDREPVTSMGHRLFGHLQAMPPLFEMDKLISLLSLCSDNLTWCIMRPPPQMLALPVQTSNRAHVNRYDHTIAPRSIDHQCPRSHQTATLTSAFAASHCRCSARARRLLVYPVVACSV